MKKIPKFKTDKDAARFWGRSVSRTQRIELYIPFQDVD